MATIDYTIPGQIKSIQLESPINQMAAVMQLRALQESSQMNALKMQEYQRAREDENELRKLFESGLTPESPEFRNMLYRKVPGLAPGVEKNILERGKTTAEIKYKETQQRKEEAETLDKELKNFNSFFSPLSVITPLDAEARTRAIYKNPVLKPWAERLMDEETAATQSRELFRSNKQAWLDSQLGLSGEKILEATAAREKQKREEDNLAYSDYVRATVMKDERPLSKAEFLAQRNQPPVPVAAPTTEPPAAEAESVQGVKKEGGEGEFPGVELSNKNLIDESVAALLATGDPRDKAIAEVIQKRLESKQLSGDFKGIATARAEIARLKQKTNPTPLDLALIADLEKQIKTTQEGRGTKVNVGVKLPPQEVEFEKELGSGQAKALLKSKEQAEDARDMLDTVRIGRDILKSGAITGAGADFFVGVNQALKTAGIDFGYGDASANSQAYAANMAQNVGKLIKLFGAGTGLSDADRAYAEKMAGGKITLDRAALEKILGIQERAANNVIKRHNAKVKGVKTNIPLEVEFDGATPAGAIKPPAVGTVQDGYKFKGGNPADKNNWEKVK
jgi:hypothetical protein